MAVIFRGKHLIHSTYFAQNRQNFLPLCFSSSSSPIIEQSSLSTQTSHYDEELVSSVVSVLKEQRSKSRWNFIKTLYPNGFSPKEVSEIILNVRNNPRLALRFFLWSERRSLCSHDLLSYSTIIHILARSRLKTLAQSLIQSAMKLPEVNKIDGPELSSKPPKIFETLTKTYRYCDSAPFVFDLLIRACLEAKKIDQTIEMVRMLRSRRIYPRISTCNLVIRLVSQLKGSEAGLDMYREIFSYNEGNENKIRVRLSPNVKTFNTVMLNFYQDGILGKVEEIWTEMEKFNCIPNLFSYSVRMAMFCDEGKLVEAVRLWEEMQSKEITPDVMTYNTLIKGFCENGEMGRAEELFSEMGLGEIEATCLTYEILVRGYCRIHDVDSAILLYKDMCRKGFDPEASTVEEVIRELCHKDKVSEGLSFLRDVMKRQGFYPTESSYEFLIKGFCKEGKMEEALKLQAEMVAKGFGPHLEIYSVFIDGYSKQENHVQVRKLRKEMSEFGLV